MIDLYCERTGPEIWSEPLNALSNGAFILAAVLIFYQASQRDVLTKDVLLLTGLIFAIGIGSGLFHLFATQITLLADVLPILLFQISFLIIYSHVIMKARLRKVFTLLSLFILLTVISGMIPRDILNGSAGYFPALIFVLGFGVYHFKTYQTGRYLLLYATGLFVMSLTMRTVDSYMCDSIPVGTHFLWHIFNAGVLYLCTYVIILNKPSVKRLQS